MANNRERLFDQFPHVSKEEWKEKVIVDLKGADFDKKLVWRTPEGFNVQPMYVAEDIEGLKTTDSLPGEYPYIRGTRTDNDWAICQDIVVTDAAEANAKALTLLDKGLSGINFVIKDDEVDFPTLFKGIYIDCITVNVRTCPRSALKVATALVDYIKAEGKAATFHGTLNFDPFKRALKHGEPFPADIVKIATALLEIVKDVPGLRCLAVESYLLCNAGAYITQELGVALSWGVQWMTSLTEAGIEPDEVAKRIFFTMGVSSNYFMELAKFRAARMLWAQIVKQYEPKCDCACKMWVHAVTSEFNQTIFDAYVNLLRSQTEAMSAALAGVDAITVTPFDKPYKTPDEFSERLARNQQLLLKEESHFDKVLDPAGGSYYIETLTVSIADVAWKLFLKMEEDGGFETLLNDGKVAEAINESAAKRHTDVARRKEFILGSNQFPNFTEIAGDKIETTECDCCCGGHDTKPDAKPTLNTKRAASEFEELRLATEHAANRPKVFMLTIGNLAMRLARSQFSANFFACAGYEIIDNLGFETTQEGIDAALEKKADIVVICSSDDEYAEYAPQAFEQLAGRAEFVVAGAPECAEELKAKGITNFIHVRSNVLDTLRAFNAKLLK